MNDPKQFSIIWKGHGRKAQCPPDPKHPNGMEIDCAGDAEKSCTASLPYPAVECGVHIVKCQLCGFTVAVTAAGRVDDAKSVKMPCKVDFA